MRGMEYVMGGNRQRKGKAMASRPKGKPGASGKRRKPWSMKAGLGNC